VQPWNAHGKHYAIVQLDFHFLIQWLSFQAVSLFIEDDLAFFGRSIDRSFFCLGPRPVPYVLNKSAR